MLLEGKVAIVSGASRGIGKSIALTLAKNSASLVIIGTNTKLLTEVADEVQSMGRQCVFHLGDVTNLETATLAAKRTKSLFGKIDILINYAGLICAVPS